MQLKFEGSVRKEIPLSWYIFWLIVPNLLLVMMLPIGGPPMAFYILIYTVIAVGVSQLRWTWLKQIALIAMIGTMSVIYGTRMFNLSPQKLEMVPSLASDIHPFRSPEYVIAFLVVTVALLVSVRFAPRVRPFTSLMSVGLALLGGLVFAFSEFAINDGLRGSYKAKPGPDDPIMAASVEAGLDRPIDPTRHVVVIIVEALGLPIQPAEREIFKADWVRPDWRERYDVSTGSVPYYGSTTNAEIRELCFEWGDYQEYPFENVQCLPEIYAARGFETMAIHTFAGGFFDRHRWYPKLKFDRIFFSADLRREGLRWCGGIFAGICDDEIPALIGERLIEAEAPQFVYFLTVNSHIPVIREGSLGTEECHLGDAEWSEENPGVCRLFLLQRKLANAVDDMIRNPDLPPTDILIVGDHVPPFYDRRSRSRFDQRKVPWVMLRSRDASDQQVASRSNDRPFSN